MHGAMLHFISFRPGLAPFSGGEVGHAQSNAMPLSRKAPQLPQPEPKSQKIERWDSRFCSVSSFLVRPAHCIIDGIKDGVWHFLYIPHQL